MQRRLRSRLPALELRSLPLPIGEALPGSARSAGGAETLAGRLWCGALSSTGAEMTLIQ